MGLCPSPSVPLFTLSLGPSFLSLSSLPSHLHSFFSSPDLLSHTAAFFSLSDLFVLSSLNRLLHTIADSDRVWRPRLMAALAIVRPPPLTVSELQLLYLKLDYTHVLNLQLLLQPDHSEDDAADEKEDSVLVQSGSGSTASQWSLSSSSSSSSDALQAALDSGGLLLSSLFSSCGSPSAPSCKQQYVTLVQCSYHSHTRCFRLLPPSPPLPLPPAAAHFAHSRVLSYPPPPHLTQPAPIPSYPLCHGCVQQLAVTVKHYYDYQGEWSGQFTITPLSLVRVGDCELDVRYAHIGGYEGVDHRRFHVQRVVEEAGAAAGGGRAAAWGVVRMFGYRSGLYAMSSPENVTRCARLEYSVLKEKEKERGRRRERKRRAEETREDSRGAADAPPGAVAAVREVNRRMSQWLGQVRRS